MKSAPENPLIYLVKKLWKYSEGNRPNVVLYSSFFVVANILNALDPLIIGFFLNVVQVQGVHKSNLGLLFLILASFLVKELVSWAFHGTARIIETLNSFKAKNNYKRYLLRGTMDLPIEWHTDHHSGDTIDKIEKGTVALGDFSEYSFQVIQSIISLIIAFGAMFYFSVLTGVIVMAISGATVFGLFLFDRKLVPGYNIVNKLENATSAKVFDTLSNVTTVIILRIEKLVLGSINIFLEKPRKQFLSNTKLNETKWFFASFAGRVIVVIVIGIYMLTHLNSGTILVGTIYILYSYADQVRSTFFQFAYLYNTIVRQRAAVSNSEELSNYFTENGGTKRNALPKKWENLSIQNLSFSYHAEDGADLHLDSISLDFKKGERVAVIGESGGGKSTFLKLVRDLYHPKALTLLIDGKNIKGGFAKISDSISLIPQDPEIFATTIRENITLGVKYSSEHLERITDMAAFTDIIKRLPKGLESSVVEKGVNLSGGEKQRLALARGLLASEDKDIVLLDEPTSSVDMVNELAIHQNIFTAFPQKTIISSIHRLHLLSLFDVIYFFKGGKIVTFGSFEDLRENSPDFQELWQKYIETRDSLSENGTML